MKHLALTFDDGPSEWTREILDLLRDHDARATFFVLGYAAMGREGLLCRIAGEGHELATHGITHRPFPDLTDSEIKRELLACAVYINKTTGVVVTRCRPPYHASTEHINKIIQETGLTNTGADVQPGDYSQPGAQTANAVISKLREGIIINLHDGYPPLSEHPTSREETIRALTMILQAMDAQGYKSITVSQLKGGVHG